MDLLLYEYHGWNSREEFKQKAKEKRILTCSPLYEFFLSPGWAKYRTSARITTECTEAHLVLHGKKSSEQYAIHLLNFTEHQTKPHGRVPNPQMPEIVEDTVFNLRSNPKTAHNNLQPWWTEDNVNNKNFASKSVLHIWCSRLERRISKPIASYSYKEAKNYIPAPDRRHRSK